jgi:hypothetical protein
MRSVSGRVEDQNITQLPLSLSRLLFLNPLLPPHLNPLFLSLSLSL